MNTLIEQLTKKTDSNNSDVILKVKNVTNQLKNEIDAKINDNETNNRDKHERAILFITELEKRLETVFNSRTLEIEKK